MNSDKSDNAELTPELLVSTVYSMDRKWVLPETALKIVIDQAMAGSLDAACCLLHRPYYWELTDAEQCHIADLIKSGHKDGNGYAALLLGVQFVRSKVRKLRKDGIRLIELAQKWNVDDATWFLAKLAAEKGRGDAFQLSQMAAETGFPVAQDSFKFATDLCSIIKRQNKERQEDIERSHRKAIHALNRDLASLRTTHQQETQAYRHEIETLTACVSQKEATIREFDKTICIDSAVTKLQTRVKEQDDDLAESMIREEELQAKVKSLESYLDDLGRHHTYLENEMRKNGILFTAFNKSKPDNLAA